MRWGLAVLAIGQTGQSEAIHSREAWASVVVKLTMPAVWPMAVVCKMAISCCPSALVPGAIELLGGGPKLHDEVAGQVLWLGFTPFLPP
jgi:hypothetical protein